MGEAGGDGLDVLLAYRRVSALSGVVEQYRAKTGLPTVQSQQQFARVLALGGRARKRLERIVQGSQARQTGGARLNGEELWMASTLLTDVALALVCACCSACR